jgi:hypothetical protein
MYNISKVLMKQLAIPLIHQKTMDKRLVIVAAGIAALFSLNTMAAEAASPANIPPAAGTVAKPEARGRNQQEWDNMTPEQRMKRRQEMRDHWKEMSPEEREQVRNKMKDHWNNMSPQEREARREEMRDHFKNMSPEERKQFDRDLGKLDGMPPPVDDLPSDSTGDAGRPAK